MPRLVSQLLFGAALVFVLSAVSNAQVLDNEGREFILGFLPNFQGGTDVELHLTAKSATMVTVEYPVNTPTFSTTVAVGPGAVTIVSVPTQAANSWPVGVVANNAVRASAPDDFVCYMINREPFTSDAALALPVDTLNTEYIVLGYEPAFHGSDSAEFAVIASFDDTMVTITPSKDLVGGFAAGVPFAITLDRGEGFLGQSLTRIGPQGDLTGTVISADRPVGMTNGNQCTNVPPGITACDHVFEVAQPVQTWGNEVLVSNLPNRPNGTVYRILASVDDTMVSQDGALLGMIDRGQFLETPPISGDHVFSADQPIFVAQFMTGNSSLGAILGDPAMGNMVPVEQYLPQYTFSTVGGSQFAENYLSIIARNEDAATILLDGAPIGAGSFTPIGATGFSSAAVVLSQGTHTTSSAMGHGITVEGFNGFDSYIYPGGALFQFINPVGDENPPLCNLALQAGPPAFFTGAAVDNRPSEDANNNSILDPGEDSNGNGLIDEDTGIFFVQLEPGAVNLSLSVDPFVPGDGTVGLEVDSTDPAFPAIGDVVATDGAGNTCRQRVELGHFDPNGNIIRTPNRRFTLTLRRPSPDTEGARCVETSDPANPDFDSLPFIPFMNGELGIEIELSEGEGAKTVCCEFRSSSGDISPPFCEGIVLGQEASGPMVQAPVMSLPMLALVVFLLLGINQARLRRVPGRSARSRSRH